VARSITIGTRGSHLALRQAEEVRARLAALQPTWRVTILPIRTHGDRDRRTPLDSFGRVGVFTSALERALAEGEIDLAVHSLKDLPTARPAGLAWDVITPRADPREALISRTGAVLAHGHTGGSSLARELSRKAASPAPAGGPLRGALADLPAGAVVGTGSVRRTALLRNIRPDLLVRAIRGNVETRLAKVARGEFEATVVAAAGLMRLGLMGRAIEVFGPETLTPAPGQGALAVEYRADDAETASVLAGAREREAWLAVMTERGVLRRLGGGCRTPVGVLAEAVGADRLHVTAAVAAPDGSRVVRVGLEGRADPEAPAARVVAALRERGADEVLRTARAQ